MTAEPPAANIVGMHRVLAWSILVAVVLAFSCEGDSLDSVGPGTGGVVGGSTGDELVGSAGVTTTIGGVGTSSMATAGTDVGGQATTATLPDGSSCSAAPADAPGAREAWESFLTWQSATAPDCGVSDPWDSYDCTALTLDPRRIVDFTQCMMSDGCNTVSEEDGCFIDPPGIPEKKLPGNPYVPWLDGVCIPKSEECNFVDDYCVLVARTVYRPELRCELRDCLEKPCGELDACLDRFRAHFADCQ